MTRWWAGAPLYALALASWAGCSAPDRTRSPGLVDDSWFDHPVADAGRPRDADDGDGWDEYPQELLIRDIAPSSCMALAPAFTEVYGQGEMPPLHALKRAGDRWMAEALWESGFVLFDDDGENASLELVTTGTLDRAAPSDDDIVVGTVDTEGVKAQRYTLTGEPLGAPMRISTDEADAVAIGNAGESALVVWSTPTRVSARGITQAGPSPQAFELETGLWKDNFHAALTKAGEGELAIAWSHRRAADSHYRSFFVRASASGLRGLPRVLAGSLESQRVVALEKTPKGYALLLERAGHPMVLPLTELGDWAGPAHRFVGMRRAHALTVNDNGEMLLAGLIEDNRDALLLLDETGAPKGDLFCLDAASSHGEHAVGLAATSLGYVVLHRSILGEQLLFSP